LRSPFAGYSNSFVFVVTSGSAGVGNAGDTYGVALCFAI